MAAAAEAEEEPEPDGSGGPDDKNKKGNKKNKEDQRPAQGQPKEAEPGHQRPVQQDHHGEAQGGVVHHPAAQRPVGGQSQPHRGSGPPNVGELEKSSLEFRPRVR